MKPLTQLIEAALFSASRPLTVEELARWSADAAADALLAAHRGEEPR